MFEKREITNNIEKLEALKQDVEGLLPLHGLVDCSKAVMLYEYVRIKERLTKQFPESYIKIPRSLWSNVNSPERFCEYISKNMKNTYPYEMVKGRSLRDYYEKYCEEYSLEIVLSKAEIIRLFLHQKPYPNHDRSKIETKEISTARCWKASLLKEKMESTWKYNISKSKCREELQDFYNFNLPMTGAKGSRKDKNTLIIEWSFAELAIGATSSFRRFLPYYKFVLKAGDTVSENYKESDCVLIDLWYYVIEDTIMDIIERNRDIHNICVKEHCKNARFVCERLKGTLRNEKRSVLVLLCE